MFRTFAIVATLALGSSMLASAAHAARHVDPPLAGSKFLQTPAVKGPATKPAPVISPTPAAGKFARKAGGNQCC